MRRILGGLDWTERQLYIIADHCFSTMHFSLTFEERILPLITDKDRNSRDEDIIWLMGDSGQGWKLDRLLTLHLLHCQPTNVQCRGARQGSQGWLTVTGFWR